MKAADDDEEQEEGRRRHKDGTMTHLFLYLEPDLQLVQRLLQLLVLHPQLPALVLRRLRLCPQRIGLLRLRPKRRGLAAGLL